MPLFKPAMVQTPAQKERLKRALSARAQVKEGYSRRVARRKSFEWGTHASFAEIDGAHNGAIRAAIEMLSLLHPERRINILDWGCGSGDAAKGLAFNKRLNVFGFSIDASKEWMKPDGVTFLQTAPEVLPRFLKKKGIKLDLIYERASLKHTTGHAVPEIIRLAHVLNLGGRVFVDPIYLEPRHTNSLERAGFSLEVQGNFLVSLTKVREPL